MSETTENCANFDRAIWVHAGWVSANDERKTITMSISAAEIERLRIIQEIKRLTR